MSLVVVQDGADVSSLVERIRAGAANARGLKSGKPDASTTGIIQEIISALASYSQVSSEVVLAGLHACLEVLNVAPQTATLIRLEGGIKLLVGIVRLYAEDSQVLTLAARVLARCSVASAPTLQALAKEKGVGAALVTAAAANSKDPTVLGPLLEVMVSVARHQRGAASLAAEPLVPVAKELLVNCLGSWTLFGSVIKVLKCTAKHDGPGALLQRSGEVGRLLLGVARLLARLPEQRKLLKRTCRTLWLVHRHVLLQLPSPEPGVVLPGKDAVHLAGPLSALDADLERHMQLFPEEYPGAGPAVAAAALAAQQQAMDSATAWQGLPQHSTILPAVSSSNPLSKSTSLSDSLDQGAPARSPSSPPGMVRPCRLPPALPPSAAHTIEHLSSGHGSDLLAEPFHNYGNTSLFSDMMMHDLRRLAAPEAMINRLVYMNSTLHGGIFSATARAGGGEGPSPGSSFMERSPPTSQYGISVTPSLASQLAAARGIDREGAAFGDALIAAMERTGHQLGPPPAPPPTMIRTPGLTQNPLARGYSTPHTLSNAASHVRLQATARPAAVKGTAPSKEHGTPQTLPLLGFESSFESGNLRAAVQVYENEYDLFMAPDLNDRSNGSNLCQWFHFAVWGMVPGVPYKFNIVNFRKKQSLFGGGKQPLVCRAVRHAATSCATGRGMQGCAERDHGIATSALGQIPGFPSDPGLHHSASMPSAMQSQVQRQALTEPGGMMVTAAVATDRWVRAGAHVAYYPSPYRGRASSAAIAAATAGTASSGSAVASEEKKKTPSKKAPAKKGKVASASMPSASGTSSLTPSSSKGQLTTVNMGGDVGSGAPLSGPGLYCCTFTLAFEVPGVYYIASCYPYTYTDLHEHLGLLCHKLNQQQRAPQCQPPVPGSQDSQPGTRPGSGSPSQAQPAGGMLVRSPLCYSLRGVGCEVITITDYCAPAEVIRQREAVVVTARVHPGETCASWIMQGLLDFLTSPAPQAVLLRSAFVIKCVPMLNPDGVINGSYRCSMAGVDLNRLWEKPTRWVHPPVFHTKRLLGALAGAGRLALYIDIHGHSSKEGVFFYGCEPNLSQIPIGRSELQRQTTPVRGLDTDCSPNMAGQASQANGCSGPHCMPGQPGSVPPRIAARLRVRMLPYLTARMSQDYDFTKCNFRTRKSKLGAARVVVHRELGCAGAYTMEASLGGRSHGLRTHFSVSDYLRMGETLCRAIAELAEVDDCALLEDMAAHVTLPALAGA